MRLSAKDALSRFRLCPVPLVFFRVVGIFWLVNPVPMLKDFLAREYMTETYQLLPTMLIPFDSASR